MAVDEALLHGAEQVRALQIALGRALKEGGEDHSYAPYVRALAEFNNALDEVMRPAWDIATRLRSGRDGSVEAAIVYLETAPRCFRSGYLAEVIMHRLAQVELNAAEKARVREVLGRELSDRHTRGNVSGRLAGAVWSPGFGKRLDFLAASDGIVGRRAERMVETAKHALTSARPYLRESA